MTIRRMRALVLALVVVTAATLLCPSAHAQASAIDWVVSVILPETKAISPERLGVGIRRRTTAADGFAGIEAEKDAVLLRIGGGTAVISLMPGPIPKGELQDVCRFAWHWREACDTVRGHKAHFLVVLMGTGLSKLESALLQTKIVAALIEESDAVASYWGVNLQPRDVFLKGSANASKDSIPATLWVNYRVSREPSGNINLSTRGLKAFSLMEIETKDAPMPGLELFDLVLGTTRYLIAKGPVIKDGDTIGQFPKQRIRVRHAESYWTQGEKVYRIEFGSP